MQTDLMTPVRPLVLAFLIAAASPGIAADIAVGTSIGTTVQTVRAALVDMGLRVGEVETEGPRIEAEVVLDGRIAWIYVDRTSGDITRIDFD